MLAYISFHRYEDALVAQVDLRARGIETSIDTGGLLIKQFKGVSNVQYAAIVQMVRSYGYAVHYDDTVAESVRTAMREDGSV